ncbi:unnamed protein product, partial [Phaeothamnion confervicola]
IPGAIQTWLLFHNALSQGVVVEDILKYARKTQEQVVDEEEDLTELKARVKHQELLLMQLMNSGGGPLTPMGASSSGGGSYDSGGSSRGGGSYDAGGPGAGLPALSGAPMMKPSQSTVDFTKMAQSGQRQNSPGPGTFSSPAQFPPRR